MPSDKRDQDGVARRCAHSGPVRHWPRECEQGQQRYSAGCEPIITVAEIVPTGIDGAGACRHLLTCRHAAVILQGLQQQTFTYDIRDYHGLVVIALQFTDLREGLTRLLHVHILRFIISPALPWGWCQR